MSTTDDIEASISSEVLVGNPNEVAKNPNALKEAYKEMAIIDVLVCGSCHNVFHFIKDFEEHKEQGCTGESPIKDINEREAQIWAFLLWKCSCSGETGHNNSWRLYQQWCRMPAPHRNAWITAGTNVLSTSKYAHATLTELPIPDDQLVPIQVASEKKRGRPKKHKLGMSEESGCISVFSSVSEAMDIEDYLDESDANLRSGEESDVSTPAKKPNLVDRNALAQNLQKLRYDDSIRNAQERVPPEERVARRTERGDSADGEYIVEKILAKRFNPRTKQYEYLLKWEGYPHEQNTWEPVENMETCKNLLQAFEKQLARQKELKALRAELEAQGGPTPVKVKQALTPAVKVKKDVSTPTYTPTGRLQRSSKARALDQVKAWCGGTDDESSTSKKFKKEVTSDDEDYTDSDASKEDSPIRNIRAEKKSINGSPKSSVDPELVKKLGLGGKGMPNIKGVIKVDPKQIPNLSSGVYIMSKSSGIIKIDSPGKPGTSIDQDTIRKQIMAAKQRKSENEPKPVNKYPATPAKSKSLLGQQVTEKTIITPFGQKIIQRTIQRANTSSPNAKSPVALLNKKLGMANDSLLRRGGAVRGRGRGLPAGYSITTASGNVIRVREKQPETSHESDGASSDTSDGISDPFPSTSDPIPPDSPTRDLTLCPLTGKRLARAEGEPTPPPTPSPPATPPATAPVMMKVEMSPGGTTGMFVSSDSQSLPVLMDEDGSEVKVEASAVKQLLEDGVDEGEEVSLLQGDNTPIMIRGEDGVLYQVTGENEAGQTVLVPAEGVETGADGEEIMYVTREDSSDVLSLDPSQLAQLLPGGGGGALQQVTVQVEGEPGEDATQVIAQLVHADLPSPGGTRRVVLLLPDGSLTMTDLDKEQYDSITEATVQE